MLRFSKVNAEKYQPADQTSYETLEIGKIRPNPYQPRKYFSEEAIAELASSIRQYGLLQPINVRKLGQDHYELVAGERRLKACKMAGLTHIKALVMSSAIDRDIAMIAMIENLQRENLHFFEEAEGYQSLIREHGFTQEDLARRLSKNQSTVANKLRILKLSRPVKDKIIKSGLTERHARALLRLHNETAQIRLVDKIARDNLSVKATEELVEAELRRLYGEVESQDKVIRFKCNYNIYLNTIKKSVSKIAALGVNTSFDYEDKGDYLEVLVKIMK